ncbi:MAG: hypothetical protein M1835_002857 [Candelina submexicana]|nr:MAG: hypothetical protein M1835_002857 [Candelina submexicana]
MPAKRRPPAPAPQEKKARQSRLAKENNISAEEEAEIKEAFHLFAVQEEGYANEKEGVIPLQGVRRALIALGLPPKNQDELAKIIETIDPTESGFATYAPFLTICALKLKSRDSDDISNEIKTAYRLFTGGGEGPITMAHLRRIARDLREEVPEQTLKDMILEANGGGGVNRGVGVQDFEGVMRRAGVFS